MSTILVMKAEGKELSVDTFSVAFFRQTSEQTGLPTSSILGGTVNFTTIFEMESDSDTFFATWFQESGKTRTIDIDAFHLAGTADKFLTMKIADAQCTAYSLNHTFSDDPSNPVENSLLQIQLVSPSITIGQATLNIGE
jgi:hypothetical protein